MPREADDSKGTSAPRESGDATDVTRTAEPGGSKEPDTDEAVQTPGASVLSQLGIDLTEIAARLTITLDGELWEAELRQIKEILERRERHSG
ncbi:MAG: hypothetical protein KAS89_01630, partial [Candidatus Eisenbacteria sp.]|nr:hypothetical protein [Candidatus Eisenbacteria bacterium]